MDLCKELERAGFELKLTTVQGAQQVKAQRTRHTQLGTTAAQRMFRELEIRQSEALAYLQAKQQPQQAHYVMPRIRQIEARMNSGQASEPEDAALIFEWNHLLGFEPHHGTENSEQLWKRAVAEWQRGKK